MTKLSRWLSFFKRTEDGSSYLSQNIYPEIIVSWYAVENEGWDYSTTRFPSETLGAH